jgi:hypothetical protein
VIDRVYVNEMAVGTTGSPQRSSAGSSSTTIAENGKQQLSNYALNGTKSATSIGDYISTTSGKSNGAPPSVYIEQMNLLDEQVPHQQHQQALDQVQERSRALTQQSPSLASENTSPLYNTVIRHGFETEYESEQYMNLLAEVGIHIYKTTDYIT